MEIYLSEDEQWQKVKEWWKKNGTSLLLWVLVLFAASFGWRYWHTYKVRHTQQASLLYSQLISAQLANNTTDVQLFAKNLISSYGSTPYASLTALLEAKNAVAKGGLKLALQNLQWVVANGSNSAFKQIARVRAARILLAQKQPEEALKLLATVVDSNYLAATKEAEGDAYLSMGNNKAALASYQAAKLAVGDDAVIAAMIQMKINQLQG